MDAATRQRIEQRMIEGAQAGLRAAAELVAERAIAHMPVGDPSEDPDPSVSMRERTRIEEQPDGSFLVIVDTEYAQVQHWASYEHPRGGEDRFLERAVLETVPEITGIVANTIRTHRGGII